MSEMSDNGDLVEEAVALYSTGVDLAHWVGRLADELHPVAIYLFGSRASGRAREDSDVDLCIIVPDSDEARHKISERAYLCMREAPVSKDLYVVKESAFRKRSKWLNAIEREVGDSGKLLYGRPVA